MLSVVAPQAASHNLPCPMIIHTTLHPVLPFTACWHNILRSALPRLPLLVLALPLKCLHREVQLVVVTDPLQSVTDDPELVVVIHTAHRLARVHDLA